MVLVPRLPGWPTQEPHAATVTALEPTDVIQIERESLLKLTEEAPELAADVWHQLAISHWIILAGRAGGI